MQGVLLFGVHGFNPVTINNRKIRYRPVVGYNWHLLKVIIPFDSIVVDFEGTRKIMMFSTTTLMPRTPKNRNVPFYLQPCIGKNKEFLEASPIPEPLTRAILTQAGIGNDRKRLLTKSPTGFNLEFKTQEVGTISQPTAKKIDMIT